MASPDLARRTSSSSGLQCQRRPPAVAGMAPPPPTRGDDPAAVAVDPRDSLRPATHQPEAGMRPPGRFRRATPSSSSLLWAGLALSLSLSLAQAGSVNDCHGVRYTYRERGFDLRDVPRQPRQGSQLQICPRGLTCCTEEMEKKLWTMARDNYKKSMQGSTVSIQKLFNSRANKFDESFSDLLAESKLRFHKLFQKTYGIIYEQNSDVFIDFFKDLEAYYDNGGVDLEHALDHFFSQLYQRMFTVFNMQHNFDPTYLTCVSQTMKKLQPFGDVPKKLTEQLRRSFVATRTFAQALLEGKQVVNKILKIDPKEQCVVALTKMSSCPACQGIPEIRPCGDYCINVMKGCLAYHAELGESWDQFIDNLQTLADRLVGPFDVEEVVEPIGVKISDAIMNFQDNGYDVTGKVFQDCGTPDDNNRRRRRRRRKRQSGHAYGGRPVVGHGNAYSSSQVSSSSPGGSETELKTLIKDIKDAVGQVRGFWSHLPYDMCRDSARDGGAGGRSSSSSSNVHAADPSCWNGHDAGPYRQHVVQDGLAQQEANPEVRVDISRPDIDINEQIFALKLMSKKMENAYNGQPVVWERGRNNYHRVASNHSPTSHRDYSDFEGSGGCDQYSDDEDCYEVYDTDDYYEGSGDAYSGYDDTEYGSGYGDADADPEVPETDDHDDDDDDDEGGNWPPWVTAKPAQANQDDIKLEDLFGSVNGDSGNREDSNRNRISPPQTRPTAGAAGLAGSLGLARGLVYYLVPLLTCLLGSMLSW